MEGVKGRDETIHPMPKSILYPYFRYTQEQLFTDELAAEDNSWHCSGEISKHQGKSLSVPLKRRTGAAILPVRVICDLSATHGTGFLSVEPQGDAVFTEYMLQQEGIQWVRFPTVKCSPRAPEILILKLENLTLLVLTHHPVPCHHFGLITPQPSLAIYACYYAWHHTNSLKSIQKCL